MERIPVYQMTMGQDKEERQGLIFPSEQDNLGNQSIVYTIPIIDRFHHPFDFIESLENLVVYFPFETDGQYYELDARINFPEIIFSVPKTDFKIAFLIDTEIFSNWNFYPFLRGRRNLKYVGDFDKLVYPNNGFITLAPVDLYLMDELYLRHRGIFVGLTLNFGNIENRLRGG